MRWGIVIGLVIVTAGLLAMYGSAGDAAAWWGGLVLAGLGVGVGVIGLVWGKRAA